MKLLWFHLMPYLDLPVDFRGKHTSVWGDLSPKLFDADRVHVMSNEFLDGLEFAAESGLDAICVNEHHANGYGLMPSPKLMAATLARRTRDVALCVMGNSPALYNPPTRVAEEMAMLDCISGGRLIAGFPVGTPMDTCFAYGQNPSQPWLSAPGPGGATRSLRRSRARCGRLVPASGHPGAPALQARRVAGRLHAGRHRRHRGAGCDGSGQRVGGTGSLADHGHRARASVAPHHRAHAAPSWRRGCRAAGLVSASYRRRDRRPDRAGRGGRCGASRRSRRPAGGGGTHRRVPGPRRGDSGRAS